MPCPLPQNTLQKKVKVPVLLAVNSIVLVSPALSVSLTPKSGMLKPCVVSPAGTLTMKRTRAPFFTRTSLGEKEKRCAVIETSTMPGVGLACTEGDGTSLAAGEASGVGLATAMGVVVGVGEAAGEGSGVLVAVADAKTVGTGLDWGVGVLSFEAVLPFRQPRSKTDAKTSRAASFSCKGDHR